MRSSPGNAARVRGIVLGSIVLITVAISWLVPPERASAATRPAPVVRHASQSLEDAFVDWMNAVRRRRGLRALRVDGSVSRYADRHSRRMADRGTLFHSTASNMTDALSGTGWSIYGENVGMGPTLRAVERALIRSRGHRANILRRAFDHVGVGAVRSNGSVWVTSDFYG